MLDFYSLCNAKESVWVSYSEKEKLSFVANCAAGMEELLSEEISHFGGEEITLSKGVVFWRGGISSGYRACLWSRFASRILLQLLEIQIIDDTMLYEKCYEFDWQSHLGVDSTFAIDCTLSADAVISHSHYASLRVKDAIVDRFRKHTGERPSVKTERPDVRFNLHVEGQTASLAIDLSGESLHRRGYRLTGAMAPLKETLAAAIVALSGWPQEEKCYLLDPMCGSGTLLIEAALFFADSAPGLSRNYFGFMGWKRFDVLLWNDLVDEAVSREAKGFEKEWPPIVGYDSDPKIVAVARKNIENAGLEEKVRIKQADVATLQRPEGRGYLLCNLPYGERLSEAEEVPYLYRAVSRRLHDNLNGWCVALFISKPELADRFDMSWESSHRLFNGPLPCRLFVGTVPAKIDKQFVWRLPTPPPSGNDEAFANRLRKNLKERLKWAKKESINCFRIYDSDIPEYNIAVDLYGKWVHVQEYAAPKSVEPEVAAKRFNLALAMIRETLGVRRERVYIKTRRRQRGKEQYEKKGGRKKLFEVREGGCSFLVNFTDYLDTGLFLDHRPLRMRLALEAQGKRFLNLFGYTGTATVHAAKGGALSTTTVDLSATYLNWTGLNLSLNGFSREKHELVKADTLQWLRETTRKYDLMLIDPPTFSNTKKKKRVFDIQRDHNKLITLAMKRIEREGLVFFSTNFRKFKLDSAIEETFEVRNISEATIPLDFKRNSRIHRCWEIRHKD